MKQFAKILLYQPWGIGDMIMFSPVLLNFKRLFPDARIDLACRPAVKKLMSKCEWINTFYELVPPPQRSLLTMIEVMREIRKQNYDLVFPIALATRHYMGNLFVRCSGAKYTVGSTVGRKLWDVFTYSCPADNTIHRVELNKLLFQALMGEDFDFHTKFYKPVDREDINNAEAILHDSGLSEKKVLGIHAGCDPTNPYKRWSTDKFRKLINSFLTDNPDSSVLGFLGPAEDDIIQAYPTEKFPDRVKIIKEDLGVVAALLAKCQLVLTTDSGLGHIARAMETPVLAIMGPADPNEVAPYGDDGYYISLGQQLSCAPCRSNKKKSCDKDKVCCLTELNVEDVYSRLSKLWSKYTQPA